MRTRDSSEGITELPPPPAPTARDANPWPMESGSTPASRRHGRVPRRPPAMSDGESHSRGEQGAKPPRVAIALAVAVMMMAIAFIRVRETGNIEDLAGVLFAMIVLVLFVVTRKGRGRRRSAKSDQGV